MLEKLIVVQAFGTSYILRNSLSCFHETVTELRPYPEQFRPHPHAETIRIMTFIPSASLKLDIRFYIKSYA